MTRPGGEVRPSVRVTHHVLVMRPIRTSLRSLTALLLLAFASLAPPRSIAGGSRRAETGRNGLAYVLTARPAADSLEFSIRLEFTGDASGKTVLVLPSHWGGQERLFEGIRDLRVERGVLVDGSSPSEKILTHEPGAKIRVTYRLVQDRDADFSDPGRTHRPLLAPEYFHFIGHGAFVYPAWAENEPRAISLTWSGIPDGWTLANSFGEGAARQDLRISIEKLTHALYVGGDFRIHRLLVHDRPVVAALRGNWTFGDEAFTSLVAGIVRAQREFWNDFDFPHFLITLIPTGTKCCSFGGTSVTNAFAMFIATDDGLDMRIKHLLAHELMHTWIGQKMRNDSSPDAPESLLYWFSEGFTDYYTRELLLRSGQISAEDYVDDLNRALYDYAVSPVRNEPNARIAEDYWKDRYVQKLPYLRGEMLARRWDAAIRERSGGKASLDDLVRDLLKTTAEGGERISFDLIANAARPRLGAAAEEDLETYIRKGETIPPSAGNVPEGFVLTVAAMHPFELGFDFDASRRTGSIAGVRKGGSAWEAGLRDGQPMKGFSIHWDDASLPVVIQVEIEDRVVDKKYLPQGKEILVPQVVEGPSP